MTGSPVDQSANGPVWEVARTVAHQRLDRGLDVYFDATNLNPDWYDKMLDKAGTDVQFFLFTIRYDVCRERNAEREQPIPQDAVERMILQHSEIEASDLKGPTLRGTGPALFLGYLAREPHRGSQERLL